MANLVDMRVLNDGFRNAVVKLTGILDTNDVNEVSVFGPSTFLTNDKLAGAQGLFWGLRVDRVEYSIGSGLEIQLAWNGSPPQQIMPLAGRGKFVGDHYGGWIPDSTRLGYDGTINLTTTGYFPPTVQNFTVTIEMTKLYK